MEEERAGRLGKSVAGSIFTRALVAIFAGGEGCVVDGRFGISGANLCGNPAHERRRVDRDRASRKARQTGGSMEGEIWIGARAWLLRGYVRPGSTDEKVGRG